jgi:hypothetical protein
LCEASAGSGKLHLLYDYTHLYFVEGGIIIIIKVQHVGVSKELLVSTEWEAGWNAEPVWRSWRK